MKATHTVMFKLDHGWVGVPVSITGDEADAAVMAAWVAVETLRGAEVDVINLKTGKLTTVTPDEVKEWSA